MAAQSPPGGAPHGSALGAGDRRPAAPLRRLEPRGGHCAPGRPGSAAGADPVRRDPPAAPSCRLEVASQGGTPIGAGGWTAVSRSPSGEEVTVTAFLFPPGPRRGGVTASGEALGPPSALPHWGPALPPDAFSPRTAAPLSHSGSAGRAGGWSACCPSARKMVTPAGELALFALGILLVVCQALENTTSTLSDPPVAAAVVSHFNDCPDSHSQFCFHGTCRFLVQEDKPACVCHSGYVGARCEHADLLAVVAASQKKQAITALVVVSVVALAVLIIACVLIHCCQVRKHCERCRALVCRHEKPSALLKGRTACCHSETVV
ncbi:protransforming growth factor alpha [Choloepus didactylus]|uniref:protransforming growth factor alpha n=1 Tax=Choloepus didactylus TaxID=27675 RepID=UPI00189CA9C0|nr:protransforming growth factor alpha [Choloepus didactylus]